MLLMLVSNNIHHMYTAIIVAASAVTPIMQCTHKHEHTHRGVVAEWQKSLGGRGVDGGRVQCVLFDSEITKQLQLQ